MKRTLLLFIPLLLLLAGCTLVQPIPDPPDIEELAIARVISAAGAIYRPLVTGSDDWYVQPGNLETLDFSSGHDQYGDPVGLLDDDRWTIQTLHVRLDQKAQDDTLFWPSGTFPVPHFDNSCVWFPGYTAPIDVNSGLPYSLTPLTGGYPYNPCQTNSIPVMSQQMATILAAARTDWIEIEITAPTRSGGEYTLDLPGHTPTASNVLTVRLGSPQTITVLWTSENVTEVWEVEILVDWFWINGKWRIPVGPTGVC